MKSPSSLRLGHHFSVLAYLSAEHKNILLCVCFGRGIRWTVQNAGETIHGESDVQMNCPDIRCDRYWGYRLEGPEGEIRKSQRAMHYLSKAKINKARFIIVSSFFEFLIGRRKELPASRCRESRRHATEDDLLPSLLVEDSVSHPTEINAEIAPGYCTLSTM